MQSIYRLILAVILLSSCNEKNKTFSDSEIAILPQPSSLVIGESSFALKDEMTVFSETNEAKKASDYFIESIKDSLSINLQKTDNKNANIVFKLDNSLTNDAYHLSIIPNQVIITANGYGGFFYGVQSINQLLSKEFLEGKDKFKYLLPAVTIKDNPRFKWRAYMLDESRYFHGEKFVKQMLDQMALLKMNIFHWHLVDDAGWRIEIKKYPKLTEIGSKRDSTQINHEGKRWESNIFDGKPHSGFYTQEQIKNIVAYATERNITIVPEFEMPGHSSAAIATYTWLGTAGKDIDVPVKFGRLYDNYDVTKPEVIQFIKDVLTEMFELFPSKVIHIGGDEVGYKVWEETKHVQDYMKKNNIKTPADLQIQFTNNISNFIESNGKRMMGWNEILGKNIHQGFEEKKHDKEAETELAKNVVVHFWKGDLDLVTDAAKKGYDIVNSLHSSTYLDYDYKSISLEKAYSFNPIPEGLEEQYHKNILGLGCQMWSEWTPTNTDIEYQTFPRIAAYAEVGWTQLENKDYSNFKKALKNVQKHWDNLGINYHKDIE
ncbi:beta-N-acetylhexosaminidase [Sabulilitoribacter arenilitoris]|uniref:beta-N-acetylhexosaminidase n=1 Tax=Wocania arenilitoris TaxID=2044858 RepID=A0AAE3EM37_9FLAO|nr:beta-N-acetylhexosaminidase [Wocania arenilitoris]MCF7567883.1 beta-N-acetylhexosaminidase [Wocania arenilitoris]